MSPNAPLGIELLQSFRIMTTGALEADSCTLSHDPT